MQTSGRRILHASLAMLALFLIRGRVWAQSETPTITSAAHGAAVRPAAQPPNVTNQDVLDMTKAGLSAGIIVDKISSVSCRFDTSVPALAALKASGVDNSVISAMIRYRPHAARHDQPYVWIGANEERISNGNHTTIGSKDSGDGLSVTTSSSKTTTQTHSEYAEVTRELINRCKGFIITNKLSDADYAVTVERYHAGHLLTQRNTFSVFRTRDDNLILSDKTTWLKNAADDICNAISQDIVTSKAPQP